jgi:hypothetical protein
MALEGGENTFYIKSRIIIYNILSKMAQYTISRQRVVVLRYSDRRRCRIIDLINKIKKETEMVLGINEAYSIYMAVEKTKKISGEIAEVGVYKGGSAKLICEAKGEKSLHLFDTFEGIPRIDSIDSSCFYKGQYAASMEEVKSRLKNYDKVYFYKGIFPASSDPVKNKKFSFVHLDVDTYESTLDCLNFFYPRMMQGGIIISHDYINSDGVRTAFDEFFKDKIEPVIELSGSQCLIEKTSQYRSIAPCQ